MLDRFVALVEQLKSSGKWKWLAGALAVLAAVVAAVRLAQRVKRAEAKVHVQNAKALVVQLEREKGDLFQKHAVKQSEIEAIEDQIREHKNTIAVEYKREGMSSEDISKAFSKLGY